VAVTTSPSLIETGGAADRGVQGERQRTGVDVFAPVQREGLSPGSVLVRLTETELPALVDDPHLDLIRAAVGRLVEQDHAAAGQAAAMTRANFALPIGTLALDPGPETVVGCCADAPRRYGCQLPPESDWPPE
jgi:hypothetical protein